MALVAAQRLLAERLKVVLRCRRARILVDVFRCRIAI